MLAGFSALNEYSNPEVNDASSSDGSPAEESVEFRDEDYLILYNRALASFGEEAFERAENEFRHLTTSPYFAHCGYYSGAKKRPVTVRLQFNAHRYLGLCLSKREAFAESLNELEKALEIDNSEPTLYFKFAVIAVRAGDLKAARNALEASFKTSDTVPGQPIRHWPSLDLIISITYKLDDCIACLRYIEWALTLDPSYEKGFRIQKQIYQEYPFLSPDPEEQKKCMKPRPIEVRLPKKNPTPPKPKIMKIKKVTIENVVNCVVNEYNDGGNGRMKDLLLPCSVEIEVLKPPQEVDEAKVILEEIRDIVDSVLYNVCCNDDERMEVDNQASSSPMKKELSEAEEIAQSIAIDDVINKAVTIGFVRDIIFKAADFAVGESYANAMSKKRNNGPSASFLSEVPLDLIEKRRSARRGGGRGGCGLDSNSESMLESPRGDDMTARALLESLFPPNLVCSPMKKGCAEDSPMKKLIRSPAKKESSGQEQQRQHGDSSSDLQENWISIEDDEEFAKKCIEDCMTNTCLNSCLADLLVRVTDKLKTTFHWPRNFDQAYLNLYLCWRPHFVLPHEFGPQKAHQFIEPMIISNEIVLRDLAAISIYDSENEELGSRVDQLTEHLWEDLQHLVLHMFRVTRPLTLRILSLHLHYYKFKGKIQAASGMADKMKPFLDEVDPKLLKSPVVGYDVFKKEMVDAFIENQRNRQLISSVNQLFSEEKYSIVKDVLLANLEVSPNQSPSLTAPRLHHLLMMVESLWNLDDYESTMVWIEQSIHELIKCNDPDLDTKSDLLNLLKTLECCIVMTEGNFAALDERPRLASNLMKLLLMQVDGDEECNLGEKTVLPWVLLYHLIAFDEKAMTEFEDDVPNSVNFLCSAHDYLGPLALCTAEGGKLLTLLVTGIVDTLFKGVANKATSDQLCRNMDQALYCLYAHPSKKSKARHLVDHNINNVAFTWERCLKPYLYLRPQKLPEYDDLKSASISAETVTFFKRIIALVPDKFRIKKRAKMVKEYLLRTDDEAEFPSFDRLSEEQDDDDDDDCIMVGSNDDKPFPVVMVDLFYLLADFYIKNSEFKLAIDFYLIDVSWNPKRKDSWVSLSLALCNQIDSKINEMENRDLNNDTIKEILSEARAIRKSFLKCIQLSPKSTTVRIESANFGYSLLAFCRRQVNDENVESLSMDLFNTIDELRPIFTEFALENYDKAVQITTEKAKDGSIDSEESYEHDERWLSYMMTGKIREKQKKPLKEALSLYLKAMENLVSLGAKVPRKVNFNSPPEWTLELLEVHFRMHASILKQEIKGDEFPMTMDEMREIQEVLSQFDSAVRQAFDGLAPLTTLPSDKAAEDSGPPPAKMARKEEENDVAAIIKSETSWASISQTCLKGLELTLQRFPQHFKALHLLGQYYMRSKRNKDLKKARKYLWGNDSSTTPAKLAAGGGTSSGGGSGQASLFGDRKGNNLFNGIWRMPLNEVDRPGSFSTHMGKCVNTLLEFATMTNDYNILLEVALMLRKAPNSEQKYLYEKQRKGFSKQAYMQMKKILRTKVDLYVKNKTKETQLSLLLEIHAIYLKLRKAYQSKDDTIIAMMTDLYKSIGGSANAAFDEINTFCNRANMTATASGSKASKSEAKPASKSTAGISGSSANAMAAATAAAAAATLSDPNSMKAAIDYMNAANYYNELIAAMMMGSTGSTAAASTEAYLSAYGAAAASYNSLLKALPNSISVTKTEKKAASPTSSVAASGGGSAAKSKVDFPAPKLPPSVTVSKTSKTSSAGSAGLSNSSKVASSKLLPSSGSSSKSASTLAIEKVYKKASSVQQQPKHKSSSLGGVTVSKVCGAGKVTKKPVVPRIVPSSSTSISAAAVASANEILMRERNVSKASLPPSSTATPSSSSLSPAQAALAKLKSFRSGLPSSLKKTTEVKKKAPPSSPKVIEVKDDNDEDVICID